MSEVSDYPRGSFYARFQEYRVKVRRTQGDQRIEMSFNGVLLGWVDEGQPAVPWPGNPGMATAQFNWNMMPTASTIDIEAETLTWHALGLEVES